MNSIKLLENHRNKSIYITRNSTLTFSRLMSFMLNALNGSIQAELARFFNVIATPIITHNDKIAEFQACVSCR